MSLLLKEKLVILRPSARRTQRQSLQLQQAWGATRTDFYGLENIQDGSIYFTGPCTGWTHCFSLQSCFKHKLTHSVRVSAALHTKTLTGKTKQVRRPETSLQQVSVCPSPQTRSWESRRLVHSNTGPRGGASTRQTFPAGKPGWQAGVSCPVSMWFHPVHTGVALLTVSRTTSERLCGSSTLSAPIYSYKHRI